MLQLTLTHAWLHRCTAALGIALVLALNLLAVWPTGHAWLHATEKSSSCAAGHTHESAPDHEDDSDDCVVVQFAQGHGGFALAPACLSSPEVALLATLVVTPDFAAAAPAHFLPPGCGPPAV